MSDRFLVSRPVREALDDGRPVVALETSVVAQGLPAPRNLEAAAAMSARIEEEGAVPAWTWVGGGAIRVGAAELDRLAGDPEVVKVARRDLLPVVAGGTMGATTVSATAWIAARAGIEVMATGGIGGVHPGSGDVSADLLELARTPVAVVCSGPKSILDPAATLERLDELGVAVLGFRTDRLPYFVVRDSGLALDHRVDGAGQAAAVARTRRELGMDAAALVCVPCPEGAALDPGPVQEAVRRCIAEAGALRGASLTPFLLDCLRRHTGGASLEANVALLEENAGVAAAIAAALAR